MSQSFTWGFPDFLALAYFRVDMGVACWHYGVHFY